MRKRSFLGAGSFTCSRCAASVFREAAGSVRLRITSSWTDPAPGWGSWSSDCRDHPSRTAVPLLQEKAVLLTPNVREGFYPLTCCFLSRSPVYVIVESFLSHLFLKAALRTQCHCSHFPDACTARKQPGWDLNPCLPTTSVVCFILELGILARGAIKPELLEGGHPKGPLTGPALCFRREDAGSGGPGSAQLGNFPAVCPSTNQPTPLN